VGLDDLMSTETAFVAAATAAVMSPRTRDGMRKGAVVGLAGVLKAGDVVAGAARGAVRGVRGQETDASDGAVDAAVAVTPDPSAPATPAPSSTRARRATGSSASGPRSGGSRGQTSA
jgi:hypothetical protein